MIHVNIFTCTLSKNIEYGKTKQRTFPYRWCDISLVSDLSINQEPGESDENLNATAATVAQYLVKVVRRYAMNPQVIYSDNGAQFVAQIVKYVIKIIHH